MSGLFKSTTIKGNRLTEFAQTTATVGNAIPYGWGRFVAPCNIIWADLPPKEQKRRQRVGKGGTKQETYTYLMSYAVGVCKGPVAGFWWIKRNGKVVYTRDPSAPVEDKAYATKWQQRVSFYFGLDDQLPDGTIEAVEGVGQVSAFPGTAYFVVENEDVTDTGGAPPSYEVCVIATLPNVYLTSKPYSVVARDGMTPRIELPPGKVFGWESDELSSDFELIEGRHREVTVPITFGDGIYTAPLELVEGTHRSIIAPLPSKPDDLFATTSIALLEGEHRVIIVAYNGDKHQTEKLTTAINLPDGVHQ